MRILILGNGGREHALAWRLQRDPDVSAVLCAPGNAGIATQVPVTPLNPTRADDVLALIDAHGIDLTVVGPEAPLAAGLVDRCLEAGHPVFGPSAAAARLETSKAFAKAFMERHHVPTARFVTCHTAAEAVDVIRTGRLGEAVVVKADGLAAGKGVVVAPDHATAVAAVQAAMVDAAFGEAGRCVVLEECLTGPEVSCFVVADGGTFRWLLTAQDHKRMFDNDEGPNTGGMGAFAPSPLVDAALQTRIEHEIILPVLQGMVAEGHPFRGFLYAGLMLTALGPKVIEFNVRFGDPEAQVVLPLIDAPLAPLLMAAATGRLHETPIDVRLTDDRAVGVVLATRGYPGPVDTGQVIHGLDRLTREHPEVLAFFAGVAASEGRLVTAGGRVMTLVARAPSFAEAISRVYDAVQVVHFDGMQLRRDIGRKAIGAGAV
jgi:phosphoribosylamine--glycine ligase